MHMTEKMMEDYCAVQHVVEKLLKDGIITQRQGLKMLTGLMEGHLEELRAWAHEARHAEKRGEG